MNVSRLCMNIVADGRNGESHEMDMGQCCDQKICVSLRFVLCLIGRRRSSRDVTYVAN
jgi:hypothetical protein